MSESLLAELERKCRNNPDIEDFATLMVEEFKVRKIHIEYLIRKEAKDLAIFDSFSGTPEGYIKAAMENCHRWSQIERRTITPSDLVNYGTAYLFFQAIERKQNA